MWTLQSQRFPGRTRSRARHVRQPHLQVGVERLASLPGGGCDEHDYCLEWLWLSQLGRPYMLEVLEAPGPPPPALSPAISPLSTAHRGCA